MVLDSGFVEGMATLPVMDYSGYLLAIVILLGLLIGVVLSLKFF